MRCVWLTVILALTPLAWRGMAEIGRNGRVAALDLAEQSLLTLTTMPLPK